MFHTLQVLPVVHYSFRRRPLYFSALELPSLLKGWRHQTTSGEGLETDAEPRSQISHTWHMAPHVSLSNSENALEVAHREATKESLFQARIQLASEPFLKQKP